ncbi:MAG: hypothetical protein JSR67_01635 [Proteobacteria bacterium]|nr:hypothetical protein [Pseudomonadota bacterium]
MSEYLHLLTRIAALRRGPQDLPASPLLLALTVLAYLALNLAMGAALPPLPQGRAAPASWPLQLLVDALFTLTWYGVLLRSVGRAERSVQTLTALFGFQLLVAPLLVGSEWLMRRFIDDDAWRLPIALAGMLLVIWLIAVNAHIVRAALEWSISASVALVILQIVAAQLLLLALFPVLKG